MFLLTKQHLQDKQQIGGMGRFEAVYFYFQFLYRKLHLGHSSALFFQSNVSRWRAAWPDLAKFLANWQYYKSFLGKIFEGFMFLTNFWTCLCYWVSFHCFFYKNRLFSILCFAIHKTNNNSKSNKPALILCLCLIKSLSNSWPRVWHSILIFRAECDTT